MSEPVISRHYWISSSPFFETTLFCSHVGDGQAQVFLRDPDGAGLNEVTLSFLPGSVSILELEPLMAGCKLESGLKHAHLEFRGPASSTVLLRLHTGEGASVVSELLRIQEGRGFFPFQIGGVRSNFLVLVNLFEGEAQVRARFICANRSPEVTWNLPPLATRIIDLGREFGSYLDLQPGQTAQAYVRLGTKAGTPLGYQVLERASGSHEGNLFSMLG